MSQTVEVKVPNIGDFADVEVIEILVAPGQLIRVEQSLVTVESDKASMEIPSPAAGTVRELRVKVGDHVSEGSLLLLLEPVGQGAPAEAAAAPAPAPATTPAPAGPTRERDAPSRQDEPVGIGRPAEAGPTTVRVPNIGDFKEVEVIEILVRPGERVQAEQSLMTVESDKASMEILAPFSGTVVEVLVRIGTRVSEGTAIVRLDAATSGATPSASPAASVSSGGDVVPTPVAPTPVSPAAAPVSASPRFDDAPTPARSQPPVIPAEPDDGAHVVKPHASPSVRRLARDLGVDLSAVRGSGPKQRIVHDDVRAYVKSVISRAAAAPVAEAPVDGAGAGLGLLPWPKVDFARFGAVESRPQGRIRKISAANLHRNWVMIPHVTNHDDADVTDLEEFRVRLNRENEGSGVKVTMLAFLVKACVAALRRFPEFNASLDGDAIVLKRYYHIGVAADTPNGLVVPVVRDADQKGVLQIAKEMAELAAKAREGKLSPGDMQGGSFSISSLGGIGGTYFTPIINAPEVAILGVCKAAMRPMWDGKQFAPRLMLPLSLSWDHRVIDGAAAARFNAYLGQLLADFRRTML